MSHTPQSQVTLMLRPIFDVRCEVELLNSVRTSILNPVQALRNKSVADSTYEDMK